MISADHSAAARVNLTADSGVTRYSLGVAVGSGGVPIADSGGGVDGQTAGQRRIAGHGSIFALSATE